MIKKYFFLFFVLCVFAVESKAQNNSSAVWIDKGIAAHEKGNYQDAVSYYKNVTDHDTLALLALYEMAYSYSLDSTKYPECFATIDKALTYPMNEYRILLTEMRGNVYDLQKKYKEAYQVYDSLIAAYPLYHQPWFEKGVSYFNRKMYEEAASCLEKSLTLNPYHTRSHSVLGSVYMKQGRLSEAYMAIQASLLTTSRGSEFSRAVNDLQYINEMNDSVISYSKNKKEKFKNETFDEIDELLISKIAFGNDFQVKTEIDDRLTRNLQVILEKVKYVEDDKSFAMQFYVPMYAEVFKKDLFDPFVVLLYSEYGIKSVDKYAKKIKGDLKEVKAIVFDYFDDLLGTHELDYTKRKKMERNYHLLSQDNILVESKMTKNDDGEKNFVGPAKLFRNQILLAEGKYDAEGKREGIWKFYYTHGPIKSEETYTDHNITKLKKYNRNGTITLENAYNEKGDAIEEINYNNAGIITNKSVMLEKNKIEYTTYHKNGAKEAQYQVNKKEVEDGEYEIKNDNGTLYRKLSIVNGKNDGEIKIYNSKNVLISAGNMVKGKREGEFIERYDNGNLKEKFNYENDKRQGEYILYNYRGIMTEKGTYYKDKLDGDVVMYDARGKEKCTFTYDGGEMAKAKFADSVMMQYNSNKVRRVHIVSGAGTLSSDYTLDGDGEMNGMVNLYYQDGSKMEERSYKNGKLQNEYRKYFANGQLSEVFKYKEGKLNGSYTEYNKEGKTIAVGQYVDGEQEGYWLTYNDKDIKIEERFFIAGELNGPRYYYESDGKLRLIDWYNKGLFCATSTCDTTGKIIFTNYTNNPDAPIVLNDFANRKKLIRERKNGVLNGAANRYFFNGNLQETVNNVNGDFEGKYIAYNINGSISIEGEYLHDKKIGKWINYDDAGNKRSVQEYDEFGEQISNTEFVNNEVRATDEIMQNDLNGKRTFYGEDKKIACVLIYDNDDLVAYTYEDKNGQLLPEIKIFAGTAAIQTYYSNGAKAATLNYKNGYQDGKQTIYFSNGKTAEEKTIKSLMLTGVWRRYAANGQMVYEGNFVGGDNEGDESIYNDKGELLAKLNYYNDEKHGKVSIRKKDNNQMIDYTYRYGIIANAK
jgi:uncharacterized protein